MRSSVGHGGTLGPFRTFCFRNTVSAVWSRHEPDRTGAARARARPGQPGHHRGPARRQARRLRARRPALRRDPARGRHPDRVRARPVRRLPARPRAAAAAADVQRHRGARPGDGGARRPPRRQRPRPTRSAARSARSCGRCRSRSPRRPRRCAGPAARRARPGRRPARPRHHDRAGAGRARSAGGCGSATAPRPGRSGSSEVDPWAVVVRHGRWYLLCRSHSADARRAYRIDRVRDVRGARRDLRRRRPTSTRSPMLEEHLAVGWEYDVEVVIDAPLDAVAAVPAPRARPARGGRRRHHPAGRQHQQPGLVRRAARGDPGAVPGGRRRGAPRVRGRPGPAPGVGRLLTRPSVVVEHAEEVALGVAEHHEVGVLGVGPVGHPLGTQPHQPLDLGPLLLGAPKWPGRGAWRRRRARGAAHLRAAAARRAPPGEGCSPSAADQNPAPRSTSVVCRQKVLIVTIAGRVGAPADSGRTSRLRARFDRDERDSRDDIRTTDPDPPRPGRGLLLAALAAPAGARPFPGQIDLPDGFRPEGIAIRGGTAYFGSLADGDIYAASLRTGDGKIISEGPGTPSVGLKVDNRGRLFIAGGAAGNARVVDTRTGAVLASYAFATAPTFVNDVVLAPERRVVHRLAASSALQGAARSSWPAARAVRRTHDPFDG